MLDEFAKVKNYITYLKEECGFNITVHDSGNGFISENIVSLIPYNVHSNGYCMYAKKCRAVWDGCLCNQKKVMERLKRDGAFFGMCFMGAEEFVFPINCGNEVIGFVSVGGYAKNCEKAYGRIFDAAKKYGIDYDMLIEKYNGELCREVPKFEYVATLAEPLCDMLALIGLKNGFTIRKNIENGGENYIYGHIVSYIEKNYMNKIGVDDLCLLCHCSRSYISHMFAKKSGMGICEYVNRKRCEAAEKLLTETNGRILEIAYSVGFEDSNYFSNVFSKYVGVAPRKYRMIAKSKDKK